MTPKELNEALDGIQRSNDLALENLTGNLEGFFSATDRSISQAANLKLLNEDDSDLDGLAAVLVGVGGGEEADPT